MNGRSRGRRGAFGPVLIAALLAAAWTPLWLFAPLPGESPVTGAWLGVVITALVLAGLAVSVLGPDTAPARGGEAADAGRQDMTALLLVVAALGAGVQAAALGHAPATGELRLAGVLVTAVVAAAVPALMSRRSLGPIFTVACMGPLAIRAVAGPDPALAGVLVAAGGAILLANAVSAARLGRLYAAQREQDARVLELEQTNQALTAERTALQTESRTDVLTGLANRRHLEEVLDSEWNRCRRSRRHLACALIDIDHFKAYNDCYGHDGGDACLRRVAEILTDSTRRPGDLVARLGGEEFVVLLPETGAGGATTVADLLKRAICDAAIAHPKSPHGAHLTVSIGVASVVPDDRLTPEELLKAADLALYEAKRAGRNRVVLANAETLDCARTVARGMHA